MKLRSICPVVREGIAWDPETQYIDVNLSTDRTGDEDPSINPKQLEDFILFHNDPAVLVTASPFPVWGCLYFGDTRQIKQSTQAYQQQEQQRNVSKNIRDFHKAYKDLLRNSSGYPNAGNVKALVNQSFGQYDEDRRDRLIQRLKRPDGSFISQLGNTDDGSCRLIAAQLGVIYTPSAEKKIKKSNLADLQKEYKEVQRQIIGIFNSNTVPVDENGSITSSEVNDIVMAIVDRIDRFKNSGELGFDPDIILIPVSKTVRPAFVTVVDNLKDIFNVPIIQGIIKGSGLVTYTDPNTKTVYELVKGGRAGTDIPPKNVGHYLNLRQVADKIAANDFKITNMYPNERKNLKGLLETTPDLASQLQSVAANKGGKINILFFDDSIYSGSTQNMAMTALMKNNRIRNMVGNMAGFGVIKAEASS